MAWYDLDYRNCVVCGARFFPSRWSQKTHSIECQIVYQKEKSKDYNKKRYAKLKQIDKIIAVNKSQNNNFYD